MDQLVRHIAREAKRTKCFAVRDARNLDPPKRSGDRWVKWGKTGSRDSRSIFVSVSVDGVSKTSRSLYELWSPLCISVRRTSHCSRERPLSEDNCYKSNNTVVDSPDMCNIVKWKRQNLEFRKITITESCLMVGTRKPMENLKKILVPSAPNRGPKFQKMRFFLENACFLALIFYLQLSDCCDMYRWKEIFILKKMAYYLTIYLHIW